MSALETRRPVGARVAAVAVATGALAAAAPAAAQDHGGSTAPVVVYITSAPVAGTYTVAWRTLGGCDPGAGTSGMAGEVTLTVAATGSAGEDPAPGELVGTPDVAVVVTRAFCPYAWSVSMLDAATGGNCVVGPAPFAPDTNNRIVITLEDPATACAQQSRIVVRLNPAVPVAIDAADHDALRRHRLSATARRVENAPSRCSTRTGTSRIDDNGTPADTTDDTASIMLGVLATTASSEACRYDVTLHVPGFLVAIRQERRHEVFEDVKPPATIDFSLGVATKTIFLLQTVVGDAGGAFAHYDLTVTCGESDIPEPLLPLPAAGGIQVIEHETLVELREGRFNITAALAEDSAAPDAFDGVKRRALDQSGDTCDATVSVSRLPEHCTADDTTLTVDLTRSPDSTIIEFKITCDAPGGTREPHKTSETA